VAPIVATNVQPANTVGEVLVAAPIVLRVNILGLELAVVQTAHLESIRAVLAKVAALTAIPGNHRHPGHRPQLPVVVVLPASIHLLVVLAVIVHLELFHFSDLAAVSCVQLVSTRAAMAKVAAIPAPPVNSPQPVQTVYRIV